MVFIISVQICFTIRNLYNIFHYFTWTTFHTYFGDFCTIFIIKILFVFILLQYKHEHIDTKHTYFRLFRIYCIPSFINHIPFSLTRLFCFRSFRHLCNSASVINRILTTPVVIETLNAHSKRPLNTHLPIYETTWYIIQTQYSHQATAYWTYPTTHPSCFSTLWVNGRTAGKSLHTQFQLI